RPADTAKALEAGADGCLTEPVEPVVLVATVRSLLRLREALQAVNTSNTVLRQIISSSPAAIIVLGSEGKVETWNPAAEKIFGWSEGEVLGKKPPLALPDSAAASNGHALTDRILEHETRLKNKDGAAIDVTLSSTPFRVTPGSPEGVLIMCTDIAARKLAEREREEAWQRERDARQESEKANRAKDDFLAVLSHELRSPLNAIASWAWLLQNGNLSPEKSARAIDAIQRNSLAQTRLINDLLDISRIIAGKLSLEFRQVDLSAVIESVLETVRPTAESKRIEILTDISPAVQAPGDALRVGQIIRNLLSNAVKFTPNDGAVSIQLRQNESHNEIIVKDNGVGIDPALLPHVFERFRQGNSSPSRAEGGLGLGLAIAHHLAELHGGTLKAESAGNGLGATFTLALPIDWVSSASSSPAAPTFIWQGTDAVDPLRDLEILIVDDEQDSREVLAVLLEQKGARIFLAGSVQEAMEKLDRITPDVMLSDIGMANEDGFVLIRKVREREAGGKRKVHAIAITGYVSSDDRSRALREGYDMYLSKPVDLRELLEILGRVDRRKTVLQ
ncbi:MAG TPA: ATP-binding protein, partial [Candidatus Binataceae bacterium]|nr:ATP-binding protein [Candidatus Binataceae bacterium]